MEVKSHSFSTHLSLEADQVLPRGLSPWCSRTGEGFAGCWARQPPPLPPTSLPPGAGRPLASPGELSLEVRPTARAIVGSD